MVSAKPSDAGQRVALAFGRACRELAPLAEGARLLLGCSAGGDSMALLDLAARRARRRRWQLAVAHLDHAQRPESAEEARFVAEQAARHGLPCFMERLSRRGGRLSGAPPMSNKSSEERGSAPDQPVGLSEDSMRRARHACFSRFARVWGADAVLLAHQADDCAETFLIRLLAGSGPTGLAGIRPVERVDDLTLVRPLLAARRADLRTALAERGLAWHDDPTNADRETKRGWVRNVLLPLMGEKLGQDPAPRIARAARLVGAEAAALAEAAGLILAQLASAADDAAGADRGGPGGPAPARLDLAHPLWRQAGRALRRQILRQWLWELRRGPHPPLSGAVDEALVFAERGQPGAELRTVESIHIVHCGQCLLAFPPEADAAARQAAAAKWRG
ncbi:MAG: tRNA lysidine(34) synthetase TilS [bacterium]|nr:tRNA lysidine(34) synthetase TilS [bacterium]